MNFKFTDMKIEIELPKGFMNTAVTTDNFFIADTNDSANWDKLKFPLPKGKWSIYSTSNKKVILQRSRVNLLFIFNVVSRLFCSHKYSLINQFEMKSEFDIVVEAGKTPNTWNSQTRRIITDYKCNKCNKIKRLTAKTPS